MIDMGLTKLEAAAEAVLFAAGEPVEPSALAAAIGQGENEAEEIVNALIGKYADEQRGIKIIKINESYQMCTSTDFYDNVKALYQSPQKKQLTQPLLETLAIVAYKQPVTKAQVEEIRGVDANFTVNKLAEYGLVCEKGRQDSPGRPILFGTTDEFLRHFGLATLEYLPEAKTETEAEITEE